MHIIEFETRYKTDGAPVHWVSYAPSAAEAISTATVCPVAHIKPKMDETGRPTDQNDEETLFRWENFFAPAYEAWLAGNEVTDGGIAVGSWPALNKHQVEAFRRAGISTVEMVAGMTDAIIEKVPLPNLHVVRDQARAFLSSLDATRAAEDMQAKDREIAELKAMVLEMSKAMKAQAEDAPKRRPGRPRKTPEADVA